MALLVLAYVISRTRQQVRRELLSPGTRIGARQDLNEVVLPASAGVNPVHAEILEHPEGGLSISAMGSSLLSTDDGLVRRVRIEPGMRLKIGNLEAWIEAPGTPLSPAAAGAARAVPGAAGPAAAHKSPRGGTVVALGVAVAGGLVAGLLLSRRPPGAAGGAAAASPTPTAVPAPTRVAARAPIAFDPTPTADEALGKAKSALVTVVAKFSKGSDVSTGSGFFVDPIGRVVTSYRVVKGTDSQQVVLPGSGGRTVEARVLATDEAHDLALLQTSIAPPAPAAVLADVASGLSKGDGVVALGIQGRGGPLVDHRGRIVGISVQLANGAGSVAVPIEDVRLFVDGAR